MRQLKVLMWAAAGAVFVIFLLYSGFQNVGSLLAQQSLWKRGAPGVEVRVRGQERSNRMILKTYDLEVQYTDAQRRKHDEKIEFVTLFSSVDQARHAEVRYDPEDPTRFVLSWALDVGGGRWMAGLFFILMSPLLGFGCLKIVQGHLAKIRQGRGLMSASSDPAMVQSTVGRVSAASRCV